jgi:hypothetical protein
MAFPPGEKHAPGDLVDEGKLLLFLQTEVTNRVPRCVVRLLAHQKRQADAKSSGKRKQREEDIEAEAEAEAAEDLDAPRLTFNTIRA